MHIAYIDCMNYANLCKSMFSGFTCYLPLFLAFCILIAFNSKSFLFRMPCRVLPHTLLRVDIWGNGNNLEEGEEANQWRHSHRMRREIYTFGKAGRIRHVKKYLVKK